MNIAIIGSGPSAFYTVQSFLRENPSTNIDVFEKLPAPFGLVRYGVAPDHQKTKNIIRLFTKYLYENNVNYYGNVEIGKTIALETLSNIYDAVVVSSGAPEDKNLSIDNKSKVKIYGSSIRRQTPFLSSPSPSKISFNSVIMRSPVFRVTTDTAIL